jgi:hypothetical protein
MKNLEVRIRIGTLWAVFLFFANFAFFTHEDVLNVLLPQRDDSSVSTATFTHCLAALKTLDACRVLYSMSRIEVGLSRKLEAFIKITTALRVSEYVPCKVLGMM